MNSGNQLAELTIEPDENNYLCESVAVAFWSLI